MERFDWDRWYASVGGRTIKIPEVEHYRDLIIREQYPKIKGQTAKEQVEFKDESLASNTIKNKAKELGADITGICRLQPEDIYSGAEAPEPNLVVLGQRMTSEVIKTAPSPLAAIECMKVYYTLGAIVVTLAIYIRNLGYSTTVQHPLDKSDLFLLPAALRAGLGELGRHGSVIHPELGPCFRLGAISTGLPIKADKPMDVGINKFCDKCSVCRKKCPAGAIPEKRDSDGIYQVSTDKCFPVFAQQYYCSVCLAVCAYKRR